MNTLVNYINEKLKISKLNSQHNKNELDTILYTFEESIEMFEEFFDIKSSDADINVEFNNIKVKKVYSVPLKNIKDIKTGTIYVCDYDYGLAFVVLYKSNNGLWSKTDTKHVNISKHFLYGDNFLDWLEKNKDLEKELYYVINKKGNA